MMSLPAMSLEDGFCMSRKSVTGGGAKSMAISELGFRKQPGWAVVS